MSEEIGNQTFKIVPVSNQKSFDITAAEWGKGHVIHYIVNPRYTQYTRDIFYNKEEAMAIIEGILDDYFSSTPPVKREGALSESEIAELEEK